MTTLKDELIAHGIKFEIIEDAYERTRPPMIGWHDGIYVVNNWIVINGKKAINKVSHEVLNATGRLIDVTLLQ